MHKTTNTTTTTDTMFTTDTKTTIHNSKRITINHRDGTAADRTHYASSQQNDAHTAHTRTTSSLTHTELLLLLQLRLFACWWWRWPPWPYRGREVLIFRIIPRSPNKPGRWRHGDTQLIGFDERRLRASALLPLRRSFCVVTVRLVSRRSIAAVPPLPPPRFRTTYAEGLRRTHIKYTHAHSDWPQFNHTKNFRYYYYYYDKYYHYHYLHYKII